MDYSQNLLEQAIKEYPFVAKHNPMVVVNPMEDRGYAETYPIGETGKPLPGGVFDKHFALPANRVGVEIYKPDEFSHHDLAAEMLHIDPIANQARQSLMKTWTPNQLKTLQEHSKDWQATLDEGRPVEDAIKNATDAALRGYTTKQWPEEINKKLKYSKEQKQMLDNLKKYMVTPKDVKMPNEYSQGYWKLI